MPDNISNELNPRIFEQDVGLEDLRKVKIYPLSVGHQLELSDSISQAVANFVSMNPDEDPNAMVNFVSFVLGLIKEKIGSIIGYVTKDETEDLLNEMDNEQLAEVIEKIYHVNFEGPVKKVVSLFLKEEGTETKMPTPPLRRSVPQSAKPMDTG